MGEGVLTLVGEDLMAGADLFFIDLGTVTHITNKSKNKKKKMRGSMNVNVIGKRRHLFLLGLEIPSTSTTGPSTTGHEI